MASLMEELIATLQREQTIYEELIPVELDKTGIIVANDLEKLQEITEKEQSIIQELNELEYKRQETVVNIGTVISRDPATLNLETLISLLDKQPEEQRQLSLLHDNLHSTIHRLKDINLQNQSLIEQSLELIEFNMNFIQSTRMSPGNNYDKNASGVDIPISQSGMFDAKQ